MSYDTGATSDSGTEGLSGLPERTAGFGRDLFERLVATAVEAGLAFAAVEVSNADPVWVPIGTAALALVKGFVAKFIGRRTGQPDSASLDPAV